MKTSGAANFSLARDGSLVYLAGDVQAGARTSGRSLPDGTGLVVRQTNPKTGADLLVLSLAGGLGRGATHDAGPLVATPFQELNAEVSPDGARLAYQ